MKITKTNSFKYEEGEVSLSISLDSISKAKDFLIMLKRAIEDVEGLIKEEE